jgi:hypothetical protein
MGKFVAGDVVVILFPFSEDKNIILSIAGRASGAKTGEVVSAVVNIITTKKD